MQNRRPRRVAELIHRELSTLLVLEVADPRLAGVTITGVQVTPDLLLARVFFTVMGGEEEVKEAQAGLEHATGFFRTALAERVELRLMPQLVFRLDKSSAYGRRIDELLDQVARDTPTPDEQDPS